MFKEVYNGNKNVKLELTKNMSEREEYREITNKLQYILLLGIIEDLYYRIEDDITFTRVLSEKESDKIFEIVKDVALKCVNDLSFNDILYDYSLEVTKKLKEKGLIDKD